ncbi:MAG: hypothetical protein ACOYZ8_08010 [Chloroflexota bacterium]
MKEIIETLFQNIFVRTIIVPLLLTIFTALLEYQLKIMNGKGNGDYRYTAWVQQKEIDGSIRIVPYPQQSLEKIIDDVKRRKIRLVGIDSMFIPSFMEFGTLALNLVMGAMAVDIASLLSVNNNRGVTGGLIVAHIGMLITVQLLLTTSSMKSPIKSIASEFQAIIAIALGFVAMAITFFAI